MNLSAFLTGLLFAIGLAIARMTDPTRIIAFLEIGPHWSPNLLFVMVGALLVTFTLYRSIFRRQRPLLDSQFHVQNNVHLDRRLLIGSAIFGIGWGVSGYCPGPLVVSLSSLHQTPWIIFIFFLVGQWISRRFAIKSNREEE